MPGQIAYLKFVDQEFEDFLVKEYNPVEKARFGGFVDRTSGEIVKMGGKSFFRSLKSQKPRACPNSATSPS